MQTFFWLVGGEVTGWSSKNLVLSMKSSSSTWVGALVPAEKLNGIVNILGGRTRTLLYCCTIVSGAFLLCFCLPCCCYVVTKSRPTLCDPINCSLPDCSVHGVLQARILKWVAVSFFRDLPDPIMNLSLLLSWADFLLLNHHSLPSSIINYLTLPFGTQRRSRRLNKAYFLQTGSRRHRKTPRPQTPTQF